MWLPSGFNSTRTTSQPILHMRSNGINISDFFLKNEKLFAPGTTKPNTLELVLENTTSQMRPNTLPSITLTTCLVLSSQKEISLFTLVIYMHVIDKNRQT